MRISARSYVRWSALAYFIQRAPKRLDAVPVSAWRDAAGVMLHLPDYFDWALDVNIQLISRVVKEVPEEAEAALQTALLDQTGDGITFTRKLRNAWTPRLTEIALTSLERLTSTSARDVLASILIGGRPEGMAFALARVRLPIAEESPGRQLAVASAQALIATGGAQEWAEVWPLIISEPAIGLEILGADAPHSESSRQPLVARLQERQLADLYLWLGMHRPRSAPSLFGSVGPTERLEELERHSLTRLQTAGTPDAVAAIERIRVAQPEARWLHAIQDDAERALRTSPGQRPTAVEILSMVEDHAKRYLSAEEDLLDAILVSLDGLQAELVGDNPTVRFLWNKEPLTPRDEIDLSIFVANHLHRDLANRRVILNREVNISTISQTDIRVEALAQESVTRPLVVTIEIKGSWHPQLLTAMETQLRDQYLAGGAHKVGLYLVGWFRTKGIDNRGPNLTHNQISEKLTAQALELSRDPFLLRARVLDCRWREEMPRPKGQRKPRSARSKASSR